MIRFNQPRYILPLIVLPFIYVFFYMYHYSMANEEQPILNQETASFNPDLPDPFLDEDDLKSKFDAFQEAHKNNRDFSAMQEIDRREEETEFSPANQLVIAADPIPINKVNTPSYTRPVNRRRSYGLSKSSQQELSDYEKQMRLFKAQMSYVEGLLQSESETINEKNLSQQADSSTLKAESFEDLNYEYVNGQRALEKGHSEPMSVEKVNGIQSAHFNTIIPEKTDLFIKAIIDEELKVSKDSRIRIRLLEDVLIGEEHLLKGQYLYGSVASFKPQRVEIHINSLLLQDQIIEVALDIYDLDGMKGLYVPESQFRELAKSMGSTMTSGQQLHIDNPPGNQMQLMYGLAKDAFNTTTQAASKAIRKNKARLKYNTMVYLVNTNKKDTSSNNQRTL